MLDPLEIPPCGWVAIEWRLRPAPNRFYEEKVTDAAWVHYRNCSLADAQAFLKKKAGDPLYIYRIRP